MEHHLISIAVAIIALPLLGALIAGLLGARIERSVAHWITISLVGVSFLLSCYIFWIIVLLGRPAEEAVLYTWARSGAYHFDVAILIDHLSALMICVVTFVSLMVHIYSVGYMAEDPSYQRFFSYMSLFTFSMLMLILGNNFLILFFGWEGVGLVSYLLIGFWFKREAAVFGGLKAFIVNRIGDVGFILAIAAILMNFNSLDYHEVFTHVQTIAHPTLTIFPNTSISTVSLICILLFIGAMGKSAQVPLHVWLPESMEGPTPISALIHAATMVTAGIYMVARASPLFEYSTTALSLILVIGATTCLLMGILAVVQHDIKRVIAYSTLSQLGYMTMALGASAYDAAIFHLLTHAFFKALLFLAAGSVIMALHHEQDMRKMGGLVSYMPITYLTFMLGALALSAVPPFAGFYSKDAIIEAVHLSSTAGAKYAYICAMISAFLTPLYIFRALFLTFHGGPRGPRAGGAVMEPRWVVLLPLIALAIPSIIIGEILVGPMLVNTPRLLANSIFILSQHDVLLQFAQEFKGAKMMALKAPHTLPFWLTMAGIVCAWFFNLAFPELTEKLKKRYRTILNVLHKKYGFDDFNQIILVRGCRRLGGFFYFFTDLKMIDGLFVNGPGKLIGWFARRSQYLQTGYLYDYALVMMIGVFVLLVWFLIGP